MDKIEIISINDLQEKGLIIPLYQRKYCWGEKQITDLLNDINEYEMPFFQDGSFYSLQTIIIRKLSEKAWEIIDGQQRLITLYIILSYLKYIQESFLDSTENFSITYERERQADKTNGNINILEEVFKEENIDEFFYISNAYVTIKKWFEVNNINKLDFLCKLLREKDRNGTVITSNVRIIVYKADIPKKNDAENIFKRINREKAPLTNAELIKTLFIDKKENVKTQKTKNITVDDWGAIENGLQDKKIWFLKNKKANKKLFRIEIIFDLLAKKYANNTVFQINKSMDEYFTFHVIYNQITSEKKTKYELWEEVKRIYRDIEQWLDNIDKEPFLQIEGTLVFVLDYLDKNNIE